MVGSKKELFLWGIKSNVMWKEKLGNYLIDVSKYVLTGVVISSFFRDFGGNKFFIYGLGVAVSALTLVTGLLLIKLSKIKEDK